MILHRLNGVGVRRVIVSEFLSGYKLESIITFKYLHNLKKIECQSTHHR